MQLSSEDPIRRADDVGVGVRLDLEDPIRIATFHERASDELPLHHQAQRGERQRTFAEDDVVEPTDVEPMPLACSRLGSEAKELELAQLVREGLPGPRDVGFPSAVSMIRVDFESSKSYTIGCAGGQVFLGFRPCLKAKPF